MYGLAPGPVFLCNFSHLKYWYRSSYFLQINTNIYLDSKWLGVFHFSMSDCVGKLFIKACFQFSVTWRRILIALLFSYAVWPSYWCVRVTSAILDLQISLMSSNLQSRCFMFSAVKMSRHLSNPFKLQTMSFFTS